MPHKELAQTSHSHIRSTPGGMAKSVVQARLYTDVRNPGATAAIQLVQGHRLLRPNKRCSAPFNLNFHFWAVSAIEPLELLIFRLRSHWLYGLAYSFSRC